jgi:hypothetical protein
MATHDLTWCRQQCSHLALLGGTHGVDSQLIEPLSQYTSIAVCLLVALLLMER